VAVGGFRAALIRIREGRAKLRRVAARYPKLDELSPEEFVTASDAFTALVDEYPELRAEVPRIDELREHAEQLRIRNRDVREKTEELRAAEKARKETRANFDESYVKLYDVIMDAKNNATTDEERKSFAELEQIFRRKYT
jgi:hypothetical protein